MAEMRPVYLSTVVKVSVLRVKLPHLDGWNARRRDLANAYREQLAQLPFRLPKGDAEMRHVYHLFVIGSPQRDAVRQRLAEHGIETGIHYPVPLHLQPALKALGYASGAFVNAERLARQSLSLPMYPEMPLEYVERIADAVAGGTSAASSVAA